jgi:hypothetical protein
MFRTLWLTPDIFISDLHFSIRLGFLDRSQLAKPLKKQALRAVCTSPQGALPLLPPKQEVTGGVTNFVARLPEVAENSQSWLASVQEKPLLEASTVSVSLANDQKH